MAMLNRIHHDLRTPRLAGMRRLFSAANEVVYLGGVKETEWLRELSDLIGDYTTRRCRA